MREGCLQTLCICAFKLLVLLVISNDIVSATIC